MTGFGAARSEGAGLAIDVEARSVNGRYLKVAVKCPPVVRAIEHQLEALARSRLQRGSVTLSVNVTQTDPDRLVAINEDVVAAYQAAFERLGLSTGTIPLLAGVIGGEAQELTNDQSAVVQAAATEALEAMISMREREGKALAELVLAMCDRIVELAAGVRERGPAVVREYKRKLEDRLAALLADGEASVDPQLLAREVAVFANRSDVTEEVDRLDAHIRQVRELVAGPKSAGRRLDFLGQELLREANTIGSKSADAELAHLVVELKATVDQLKEQAANVE
jgi:uncharacterized protein (TIGR00255 family)